MRIGYDAKRLYCNFTGLGNYSRTLLKNLDRYYPDNHYFLYTPKVKQNAETNFFIQNPAYTTRISKALFKSFWRSYSMTSQLKKDKIQLYHGLSHEIPFGIQRSGIKSIVTIHDLIFKVYPDTYRRFDQAIYDLKFKNSCQHADRIIAISESTKRDIVKFYKIDPDKIDVVYQSCSPLYHQESESESTQNTFLDNNNIPKEYLLYVGSVIARKNLKIIIEAYQHLSPDFSIPLVVVGRGKAYKTEVLKLIHRKKLDQKIIWLDQLDNNDHLKILYQKAKALIYPSLYEGFGLPIVEALLCKTPVITSNVSSLPEAGGPHSLYIDPNDAPALAHAIQRVLEDSALRANMKQQGYQYATAKFTDELTTKHLMKSYHKILPNFLP